MNVCRFIFILLNVMGIHGRVKWENIRCSSDKDQSVPEGKVADIGRFPWIGVVQHTFYLGGTTRFAVTSAVLIHPEYAIASAEDMSRIEPEKLVNNTKFIVWQSSSTKYSLDVDTYYVPSEFTEGVTLASIALLQLYRGGEGGTFAPVLPVCLPVAGTGYAYTNLYGVKMNDERGEIQKEVYKMKYIDNQECEEFYYQNKLNFKTMNPVRSVCAATDEEQTCVWEAGVALITRQTWGFWKMLGFSVRGPGCSAPARFLPIHEHLFWIDEIISRVPTRRSKEDEFVIFRRVSPIKLIMYSAKIRQPKELGMCDRQTRGHVMYKDNSEILVNKNFAQGFFFMSVAQVLEVTCATIVMEVSSRTNAAIWIEHHCHQDRTADREGFIFKDIRSRECFVYFKSVTYLEFRFFFSFKAMLEISFYGHEEIPKFIPNPWIKNENTYPWRPTYTNLRTKWFVPIYGWWWTL